MHVNLYCRVMALAMLSCHYVYAADSFAKIGIFEVDASPPIGSPLAYDPTIEVQTPLTCKGIVLLSDEPPIVLCAVDWLGIGNTAHQEFRERLAKAVSTSPDRVAVHTLHQHDAPWCDFAVDDLLKQADVLYRPFDSEFARSVMDRAANAASEAKRTASLFTHLGHSTAQVYEVASNRRILGPDGKVQHVRWSAIKDPNVQAFPEGTIDPLLRMVTFWNCEHPIVALSYYATHPQSYYRTGKANPDFPGLARNQRQADTGIPHIHFNGAGGNITAGKYNDGSQANRQVLANRMAQAMQRAWDTTQRNSIHSSEIHWQTANVNLPAARWLDKTALLADLTNSQLNPLQRFAAANKLAWIETSQRPIDLTCLTLGKAHIVHCPGELFVEYQIAAQRMQPDKFVAMAAYGNYGPAYIGTSVSYSEGGYETGPDCSYVGPEAEPILLEGLAQLMKPLGSQ